MVDPFQHYLGRGQNNTAPGNQNFDRDPVIVLTSSDMLCNRLQQDAEALLVDAFITNRRYPNYEFFCGWSRSRIAKFFGQISSHTESAVYANAFLEILAACHWPLTLRFMQKLAEHTDAEIALIGQNANAPTNAVSIAANYSQEAKRFRSDLQCFCSAVEHLTPQNGQEGYSMSGLDLRSGFVYLIDMRSEYTNLLYQYFAEELYQLLSFNSHILIILADVNLSQDSPLLNALEKAQEVGATICVSAESAGSVRDRKIRFCASVLLMDNASVNQSLQDDLKTFGTGPYYFPEYAGNSVIRWKLSNDWKIGIVPDLALVPIGEANGNCAILQGDYGIQVTIASNLTLSRYN